MNLDPSDETHPDNCDSKDQQRARVIRRWASDPAGRTCDRLTNDQFLRLSLKFWIGPVLRRAGNPRFHEYWSDGVWRLASERIGSAAYRFTGATIWSDRQATREWFAPFELHVDYGEPDADIPKRLQLKFGWRNGDGDVRRVSVGSIAERGGIADHVFAAQPMADTDWAVIVTLDPYTVPEP